MKTGKKLIALVLALAMIMGLGVTNTFAAFDPDTGEYLDDSAYPVGAATWTAGQTIDGGSYYLTNDISITGSTTYGLKIDAGDTVYIYLNGYTLSVEGADAKDTTGGYAGIMVPSDSTLYFVGSGTVTAVGGDAAQGKSGSNGGSASGSGSTAGTGAEGGVGGGGAGAGIGSNGADYAGSVSAAGKVYFYMDSENSIDYSGTKGGSAADAITDHAVIGGNSRNDGTAVATYKYCKHEGCLKLVDVDNHPSDHTPDYDTTDHYVYYKWRYNTASGAGYSGNGGAGGAGAAIGLGGGSGTKGGSGSNGSTSTFTSAVEWNKSTADSSVTYPSTGANGADGAAGATGTENDLTSYSYVLEGIDVQLYEAVTPEYFSTTSTVADVKNNLQVIASYKCGSDIKTFDVTRYALFDKTNDVVLTEGMNYITATYATNPSAVKTDKFLVFAGYTKEASTYPTKGNAAKFNETDLFKAVTRITYDNQTHSLNDLLHVRTENTSTSRYNYQVVYYPYNDYDTITATTGKELLDGVGNGAAVNALLIKDAGLYEVTCVHQTKTGLEWDTYSTTTYNVVIEQYDLKIDTVVDTVDVPTAVSDRIIKRDVEGANGEQVSGQFVFPNSWGNNSSKRVSDDALHQEDNIYWEFNLDNAKDRNNYLCQNDGPSGETELASSTDAVNTYYSGENGSLVLGNVLNTNVTVNYQLNSSAAVTVAADSTQTATYTDKITLTAEVPEPSNGSLGFRVVKGDYVNGAGGNGTCITEMPTLPAGALPNVTFSDFVSADKYLGDLYLVTIKAGDETVKTFKYTDESAVYVESSSKSDPSVLADQITDALNACEYYGIEAYTVKVEYLGLRYSTASSTDARKAGWNDEEKFIWAYSEKNFKIDVNQLNIAYNDKLDDVDKIYDSKRDIVSQTTTACGSEYDVTGAAAYVITAKTTEASPTQFVKRSLDIFTGYKAPAGITNTIKFEIAGTYGSEATGKNVATNASVAISAMRILDEDGKVAAAGAKKDVLNYNLTTTTGTATGDITPAVMHFNHVNGGKTEIYDYKPMHDILGIDAQAYKLTAVSYESNFVKTATMTKVQLVEKDDATEGTLFTTSATDYDYDAQYVLKSNIPAGFAIASETGEVTSVATQEDGASAYNKHPLVTLTIADHANYTAYADNISANDATDDSRYGDCAIDAGTNAVTHDVHFRVVGNWNSYDFILPVNQLNSRPLNSTFNKEGVHTMSFNSDSYQFVELYENGSNVKFEFTAPQDSYLEHVYMVALPKYIANENSVAERDVLAKFDDIKAFAVSGTALTGEKMADAAVIGEFGSAINGSNPITLALLNVNGVEVATAADFNATSTGEQAWAANKIAAPNFQTGGSTYQFQITTGVSNLGPNYAVVIVPVFKAYGDLIGSTYAPNLSVEKTITSATDKTLVAGTDDSIYVNYQSLFDTTANSGTYGQISMSYTGATAITKNLTEDIINEFNSVEIKAADYADFFNLEKLLPGKEVSITLTLWRNGAVADVQTSGDKDVISTKTFKWTVTEADWLALFKDDVVTFYDGSTALMYGIIPASGEINFSSAKVLKAGATALTTVDLTKYTKSGYSVDGWYEEAVLTNKVDTTAAVAVTTPDEFFLKSSPLGGGGGGGAVAPSTGYEVLPMDNNVKSDKANANEGEEVIITVKNGETPIVRDAQGNEVPLKDLGNNQYSYVQPASSVKVGLTNVTAGECKKDSYCALNPFGDLVNTAWYHEGIHYCLDNGIMQGTDKGFEPNSAATRAQIIVMIHRLVGSPAYDGSVNMFSDYKADWYQEAANWAAEAGVTKGDGQGNFNPADEIERQDLVVLLYRFAQLLGLDVSVGEDTNILSYDDALTVKEYAVSAFQWACGAGIINGDNGNLKPAESATRAEVAAMFQRFCEWAAK